MELHHDLYSKGKAVGATGDDYVVSYASSVWNDMR